MVPRIRRLLASRPRLVLAVLLAFAIEIVPPPAGRVSHRHDGGGVPHTHGRPILAGGDQGHAGRVGDGLATAPARDLHQHAVQGLVGVRGPVLSSGVPALVVSAVPTARAVAMSSAARRGAQARAPPARLA